MFLTGLELIEDPLADFWIVGAPLIWQDTVFGRLVVPDGFRTDLASIPRSFRCLPALDPDGLSRRPAVMHDWLYAWRGIGKDNADEFLKQSLIAEGASTVVAGVFYLGVHEFGQSSWDHDAGALETRDFATPVQFEVWQSSVAHAELAKATQ